MRPRALACVGALMLLVAACDSAKLSSSKSPSSSTAPTRSATASPVTATPSPAPIGVPPAITVVAVGASVADQGMIAVAVIKNPDTDRAGGSVTVTFTATSQNGQPTVTGQALLGVLGAGETLAVSAALAVPGNDQVGDVTALAVATAALPLSPPSALTSSGARFIGDAHTVEVDASLANAGGSAANTVAVAVCYDAAGTIVGGGEIRVTLPPAGQAAVRIPVSVANAPARVSVFVHSAG